MGRSELETPPELWIDGEEGDLDNQVEGVSEVRGEGARGEGVKGGGRPDEERLSMLTNVRARFRKLLYRDDGDETKYDISRESAFA